MLTRVGCSASRHGAAGLSRLREELESERRKREAERAGRVRAEASLRKRLYGGGDEETGDGVAIGDSKSGGTADKSAGGAGAVEMKVIGRIRSCFRRRFGAPRQGSVVAGSRAVLRMTAECNPAMSTDSLDQYSHVWLIYIFHENTNLGAKSQVKSKVRPPRLGGDKVGLFATRTPHRPNPIGLSLVKLDRVKDGVLYLSGIDLLDGTPILDVKPYLPPTDSVPRNLARAAAWFEELPGVDHASVTIAAEAAEQLRFHVRDLEFYHSYEEVWAAIEEILRFDIRSLTMKDSAGADAAAKGERQTERKKPATALADDPTDSASLERQSPGEVCRAR